MTTVDPVSQRWLNKEDAARYIGVSEETLRRLTRQGKLNPSKPTGSRRSPVIYDVQDLDRHMEECAARPEQDEA